MMEPWFILIVSLCIAALVKLLLFPRTTKNNPPPGPSFLYSSFLFLTTSRLNFEPIFVNLKSTYGPLFTLSFGLRRTIFVGGHSLAHQFLVQKGAVFSDRPKSVILQAISTAPYGPTWRLFRRNLATEIMHPARVKSFSWARRWVVQILIDRIRESPKIEGVKLVDVVDHFDHTMFSLLVFMCFGRKLDESKIKEIRKIQRQLMLNFASGRFSVFAIFPRVGKMVFRSRWKEFVKTRSDRDEVIIPLVKSRVELANSEVRLGNEEKEIIAYVETLVNLRLPEEEGGGGNGGRLTNAEIASMCSEFLNAGSETTSAALQWIMANLVKHPRVQGKLYDEIVAVAGYPPALPRPGVALECFISEEELKKMRYLKAVVLEGLRRHPPVHFLLPHRAMKEVEVEGYTIPEGATISFLVGEMGLDPKVWDEPMEFKPERFMVEGDGVFDVSGSKGIKMMPFGAGRRICPGSDLALLHLEYFVANLTWYFDWSVPDGSNVDLTEKNVFSVVMKNPLRARVSSRAQRSRA